MENNTVLIIDDDKNILKIIELYLRKENYNVFTCQRGDLALDMYRSCQPSIVLLDVMLPGMDGWAVLKELRKAGDVPVIMLTAKGDITDRIQGLDLGADDYVAKPFDSKELVARIKAVLRRSSNVESERQISFDGLVISMDTYSVTIDGKMLDMPPKEIELLYFLAGREGKVFTREQLLEHVWGFEFFGDSRTVDVHIKRIREKLGDTDRWQVKTIWGVGYKFEVK